MTSRASLMVYLPHYPCIYTLSLYCCSGEGAQLFVLLPIFAKLKEELTCIPSHHTHSVTCPTGWSWGMPSKNATEWGCPGEKPAWYRAIVLKPWGMERCFPKRRVASNTGWKNYRQKEDKQAHLTMAKKRMLPLNASPSSRNPPGALRQHRFPDF